MQCACALVPSLASLAIPYFFTLSHKWKDLSKKNLLNVKFVLIFSTNSSEIFFILRRTERDMIINVNWFTCIVPIILVGF